MWRYIVLNSLWFSILFLVHFYGSVRAQRAIQLGIFAAAFYVLFMSALDPFAAIFYTGFSFLVFFGGRQFRRWVADRSLVLNEELEVASKTLDSEKSRQAALDSEVSQLNDRAHAIEELYDEVSQMSRGLDTLETFLYFGEALAGLVEFNLVKLALFQDEDQEGARPFEVYELGYADLRGVFDRSVWLKDRKRAKGEIYPFDLKIYQRLFKERKPLGSSESLQDFYGDSGAHFTPFTAHPMFIEDRIFAVLSIIGITHTDNTMFPVLIERFTSEMQRVKLYENVETLATTDGLTGVFVRRHLLERLENEISRCKRFDLKLSLLMIDIDFFKRFNDDYGHLVGDVVLKQTAQALRSSVREVDLVGRYGGEEFGVLLIETEESTAMAVAERIRRNIEQREYSAYDEKLKVTISVGCASLSKNADDAASLVELADGALYRAKQKGRNRVCLPA